MHPEDIKAELRKRFGSLAAFSLLKGLPRGAVGDVLIGKSRPKAARAIADAIGKDLDIVFPGQRERETRNSPTKFQQTIKKIRACQPPSRRKVA